MEHSLIFHSKTEDLLKIFACTLLAFLLSFNQKFLTSPWTIIAVTYLLDSGHVYSTMLEVYADPQELRKPYVWWVTLGALLLNSLILYIIPEVFFYYIFYFTVFHNMRQGLGVTLLYKKGEPEGVHFYKYSYYFLTLMPFILFHLKPMNPSAKLGVAIIKSIDMSWLLNPEKMNYFYQVGICAFSLGVVFILGKIVLKKWYQGLLSLIFFFGVYLFAFVISKSELQSYLLLITSHAIPYFFLMEKRVKRTHSISFIKKHAGFFLILFFIFGGVLDFSQKVFIHYFSDVEEMARALVATPLIAHFIFDGIIWKRGNERYGAFLDRNLTS